MTRPRDPNANNNIANARVSDNTKAELRKLVEQSGLTMSEVTRAVILAGLPVVKKELKPRQ